MDRSTPGLARGLTAVLVVVAALLLPVSAVAGWARFAVLDTERYVASVSPLAEDPVLRGWARVRLQDASLQALDLPAQRTALVERLAAGNLSPIVRAGLEALLTQLERRATTAVQTGVTRVVDGSSFAPAWTAANRSAHEQLVGAIASDAAVASGAVVTLDLDALVRSVLTDVGGEGFDVASIPHVRASVPVLTAAQLSVAHRAYGVLSWLSLAAPLICVIVAGVAIGTARDRLRAGALLGVASLLSIGLTAWATGVVRASVLAGLGRTAGVTSADVSAAGALADALLGPLRSAYVVLAVIAGLGVIACVAVEVVRRQRASVSGAGAVAW